ncbi:putative integrase [Paraburkholderia unamae]|nr:putative integrase [Paraburkholderia unamae]
MRSSGNESPAGSDTNGLAHPGWQSFMRILDETSASGKKHQRAQVQSLLGWCEERGIGSPDEIRASDILDPCAPDRDDTFNAWLWARIREGSLKEGTASIYWNTASRAFSLVVNSLKLSADTALPLAENPFEPHQNPFRCLFGSPTSKNRLPETLQEALLNVLLDPGPDGVPTYAWIKSYFKQDWFYPQIDGKTLAEKVWCPSRANALALLLMLPLRVKQVRWLDRGLFDTEVWSVDQRCYVPNEHPLKNWRYKDGTSHLERFGRPSGVLQNLSDLLVKSAQLGLFINTSKVPMWSPESRRGYDMAWPYIEPAHITQVGKDVALWLNRPYSIIFEQIRWMNRYAPNPRPVSFADTWEDRSQVNERYFDQLPCFTPLFADLSAMRDVEDASGNGFHIPVSRDLIGKAFSALSLETERRYALEDRHVVLTKPSTSSRAVNGRLHAYELHGLRVAGISRLIESGVPVSVVQEYISDHATAVMMFHYKRADRQTLKSTIIASLQRKQNVHRWREQRERLSTRPEVWSCNYHQKEHRGNGLLDTYIGWIFVPGGICPVCGALCEVGHVNKSSDPDQSTEHYSPVEGGCGNCRFFSTGPAFIVDQALAMNELMLELRMHARSRRALVQARSEISWDDVPGLREDERRELAIAKERLQDEIAAIDRLCEPTILEWVNRYRMFSDSMEQLSYSNDTGSAIEEESLAKTRLVSSGSSDDIQHEIEIKLEEAGEFALALNILDAATIHGGLEHASSLSKDVCCDFMERILRAEGSRSLLMDIRDPRARAEAAHALATMAESMVGGRAVQEAIDRRGPLPFDRKQQRAFLQLASEIVSRSPSPEGSLVPSTDRFIEGNKN